MRASIVATIAAAAVIASAPPSAADPNYQHISFVNDWWGTRVDVGAYLAIPSDGKAKHPVMILLPSSGNFQPRDWRMALMIHDLGVAVMLVDSLTSRGFMNGTYKAKLDFDEYREMADAATAIRYLQSRPDIDTDRIGVTGPSLGAGAAVNLSIEKVRRVYHAGSKPPALVIALYPWCGQNWDDPTIDPHTEIFFALGDEDVFAPAQQCVNYAKAMAAHGSKVSYKIYPNSGHGFDVHDTHVISDQQENYAKCVSVRVGPNESIRPDTGEHLTKPEDWQRYFATCKYFSLGAWIGGDGTQTAILDKDIAEIVRRALLDRRPKP